MAGLWRSLTSILNGCRDCARHYGPHAIAAYLFNLARVQRADQAECFDEHFGTATAGLAFPWHLPSLQLQGAEGIHPYEATPARLVRSILSSIVIAPDRYTFVDLGSGKGRVLLLASEFPFRKIVGVEISRELHAIAEANIQRHTLVTQANVTYELRCMDAAEYCFEPFPLFLFLFNPFGRHSFQAVLNRVEESLRQTPRDAFVIYINPQFENALRASANFQKTGSGGTWLRPWNRYVIYRSTTPCETAEAITTPPSTSRTADCPA